jgi:hypothetical protein
MKSKEIDLFFCYRPFVTNYASLIFDKQGHIPIDTWTALLAVGVVANIAISVLPPVAREFVLFRKRNERTRRIANCVTGYVFMDEPPRPRTGTCPAS